MIKSQVRAASIALVLAGAVTAGATAYFRPSVAPTGIALVNADTGPTGEQVVEAVRKAGGYDWKAVPAEAADTTAYAAVITLPADLTDAMATLGGAEPRRARLTVDIHRDADADTVEGAIATVTDRISAAGIAAALAATAQARTAISSAQFTAQMLGAGVNAATAGAAEFDAGSAQLIELLDNAENGVAQLTSSIDALRSTIAGAAGQAGQLATALDGTGITVDQVRQSSAAMTAGLDEILPLLRGLPFADDARVADTVTKLQAVRDVSAQASTQLNGLADLSGVPIDPGTDLGALLRGMAERLNTVAGQLDRGADLAAEIPGRAQEGGTQLLAAADLIETGIAQLQQLTTNLGTRIGEAAAAVPPRGPAQQSALAQALSNPVDIVRN
ncbi:hypothetical protein [Nocardia sp. NBC_00416]|uniref:hypothetical protein n=1 Tax=Nocardia sp. NBC_00416 TaxID=2975991 RepID=UPI002E1B0538